MKFVALEGLGPFIAATLAALSAPTLVGARWSTAFAAAGLVGLILGAHRLLREGRASGVRAFHLMAAGLAIMALAPGVLLLPSRPLIFAGFAALAGAAICAGGVQRLSQRWQSLGEEITALRARLARREGDVRAQADRIRRLDLVDPVTGLANRRGFAHQVERSLHHAADESLPLALLLVELREALPEVGGSDPDGFGWRVGCALQRAVRGSDAGGRWDGNLLALLLPGCHDTRPAIARVRASLAEVGAGENDGTRLAGVTIAADGPWPDAEGLMAATQAVLSAARRGPDRAEVPVWPIDWGLASLTTTHPAG